MGSQFQADTRHFAAQGDVYTALVICMAFQSPPSQPLAFSASELNSLSPQRPTHTSVLSRRLPTPNGLQESIPLRQSVQAIVALGATAYEAAERVDLVLAGVAARLIDFADA